MKMLNNKTIAVAGGTGNVGSFIVKELLKREAKVVVPSRSENKINLLIDHLSEDLDKQHLDRLHTFVGNIGDEEGAGKLFEKISSDTGIPDAAVASLGRFIPAPSLLDATPDELRKVVEGYLVGHFVVARTFLKKFREHGGTYIFINGPLALEPWEGSGAGLVSIATAGQQMLFKAMAQELKDNPVRVTELMTYAFIRNRQTQPGSPIPGEAVGAYASYLVSEEAKDIHGKSIQLKSLDQLEEVGVKVDD
jgi:NAD(P)-dependent dehydrogenase (short-subunit alcohol dehydrogenase family)